MFWGKTFLRGSDPKHHLPMPSGVTLIIAAQAHSFVRSTRFPQSPFCVIYLNASFDHLYLMLVFQSEAEVTSKVLLLASCSSLRSIYFRFWSPVSLFFSFPSAFPFKSCIVVPHNIPSFTQHQATFRTESYCIIQLVTFIVSLKYHSFLKRVISD